MQARRRRGRVVVVGLALVVAASTLGLVPEQAGATARRPGPHVTLCPTGYPVPVQLTGPVLPVTACWPYGATDGRSKLWLRNTSPTLSLLITAPGCRPYRLPPLQSATTNCAYARVTALPGRSVRNQVTTTIAETVIGRYAPKGYQFRGKLKSCAAGVANTIQRRDQWSRQPAGNAVQLWFDTILPCRTLVRELVDETPAVRTTLVDDLVSAFRSQAMRSWWDDFAVLLDGFRILPRA